MLYYLKFALGIGNPISVGGMEVSTDEPLKFAGVLRHLARLLTLQADLIESQHSEFEGDDDGDVVLIHTQNNPMQVWLGSLPR